uniref:Putative glycosyltransferase n=1 Tax=Eubacterium cellulosolvens (strain ATCC 43171 / JCM 9499 / 6) TaxID=633697 RepID=I5AQA1_EUBC6
MVSAIITTHNRKTLLEKAIKSVLNQTYKDIECIVVDDCSSDGTKEYIEDYIRTGSIRYIFISKENSRGGNYARNVGIINSRGELIAFLDDDDEWMPSKIEKQVLAMNADPSVGFVYCGRLVERNMDPASRYVDVIAHDHLMDGDISKEVLIRIITTTTTTIMIRRSLIDKVGMFDENLKFWQEYEYSIRLLQVTKAKCIREPLILYRIIDGDINRLTSKINGWEEAIKYIERKHKTLLGSLSDEEKAMRKIFVCLDGYSRAKKNKKRCAMIKYIWGVLSNSGCRRIIIKKYTKKLFVKDIRFT